LVPEALREPARLAKNVYLGVAAFGGVVVLATFRDLANSIPNFWAFVKRPSFAELLQPCALMFIAFLGLSMSLFAVAEFRPPDLRATHSISGAGGKALVA
jgi:hypothetical protein